MPPSRTRIHELLQGIPGNKECPVCKKTFDDLREHLWEHRDEPRNEKAKKQRCPWPSCEWRLRTLRTMIEHFKCHTGERDFVCPHLIVCTPGKRRLCPINYPSDKTLHEHRVKKHGFNKAKMDSWDPWVEDMDAYLEDAELHGGNLKVPKRKAVVFDCDDGDDNKNSLLEEFLGLKTHVTIAIGEGLKNVTLAEIEGKLR